MYNRIAFGGSLSQYFSVNIPDLNKREYTILGTLVAFTVLFGIYPGPILDGLHYSVSTLIYSYDYEILAFLPLSVASISGLSNIKPNPKMKNNTPVKLYKNADTEKVQIITDNVQKSGDLSLNKFSE
jgi:hypothetical protein